MQTIHLDPHAAARQVDVENVVQHDATETQRGTVRIVGAEGPSPVRKPFRHPNLEESFRGDGLQEEAVNDTGSDGILPDLLPGAVPVAHDLRPRRQTRGVILFEDVVACDVIGCEVRRPVAGGPGQVRNAVVRDVATRFHDVRRHFIRQSAGLRLGSLDSLRDGQETDEQRGDANPHRDGLPPAMPEP